MLCTKMAAPSALVISSKLSEELGDECYQTLYRKAQQTGKGRKPRFPASRVTNKLLLQLFLMKETTSISWSKLEDILAQTDICHFPRNKYRGLLQQKVKRADSRPQWGNRFGLCWTPPWGAGSEAAPSWGPWQKHADCGVSVTKGVVVELELYRLTTNNGRL